MFAYIPRHLPDERYEEEIAIAEMNAAAFVASRRSERIAPMNKAKMTPFAMNLQRQFPIGTRVRLHDGRLGTVTQPARDVWQHFGASVHYTYIGVEIAVRADGRSYDVWYGCNQVALDADEAALLTTDRQRAGCPLGGTELGVME